MKKHLPLLGWIIVFEAVSVLIGLGTQSGVDGWYAGLVQPSFTPPNIAFPIMWSILYAMIAAAGYYIWQARTQAGGALRLKLFIAYMALNWSWSFIFFTLHQLLLGFIWIVVIDVLAIAVIVTSWQNLRRAALLMIPPLGWTLFAAAKNGAYWWLNR